jgi:hypothetical protein
MKTSRTLISWYATAHPRFAASHLKLCVLWYDQVIIESVRRDLFESLIEKLVRLEADPRTIAKLLTDSIVPLDQAISPDLLSEITQSQMAFHRHSRWGENGENYRYPDPETPEQFAHNQLLQAIELEKGVSRFQGHEIELAEGRSAAAVSSVALWRMLNPELPCMLQATGDEARAMAAMAQFESRLQQAPPAERLLELTISSLADMSWHDIIDFRTKGNMQRLRDKVAEAVDIAGYDLVRAKQILDRFERDAVESIVEHGRPSLAKVAIETILSNVPLGKYFNPLGPLLSAREAFSAYSRAQQFGWLYMLRDIRAAVGPQDQDWTRSIS